MSTLDFTVIDLDFPVGSKNKTATLITGETRGVPGRRRLHPRRRPPAGRRDPRLRQDPDQGLHQPRRPRLLLGRRGDRRRLPRRRVRRHPAGDRAHPGRLRGQAQGVGAPSAPTGPPGWSTSTELTGDITFEGHVFELKGGHPGLPDRHYLWQAEHRAIVGGVLLFQNEHVWVADTATPEQRAAWIAAARRDDGARPGLRRPRPPPAHSHARREPDRLHPRLPHRVRGRAGQRRQTARR